MSEAIELYALRRIYDGIREDSTFQTFEDFFDWAELLFFRRRLTWSA